MPNMKDVAKKANVGIATVSRVINNSGFVSNETRDIVERAIKDLGYIPNELARNFQKNKTNIIGVIVPSIKHEFTNNLLKEIESALKAKGYLMMVGVSSHDSEVESECINKLVSQQVGGLIITAPIKNSYDNYTFPIVSFERKINDVIPYVHTDNYAGGKHLTKKLLEKGAKKLLMVMFDCDEKSLSFEREQAFRDVCAESNTEHRVTHYDCDLKNKKYLLEVMQIIEEDNYDGIFFGCDFDARFFLNLYYEKHQKLPNELRIVSFDALETNANYYPKLYSAGHNYPEIAQTLLSLIFSQMNNADYEKENRLDFIIQDGNTI